MRICNPISINGLQEVKISTKVFVLLIVLIVNRKTFSTTNRMCVTKWLLILFIFAFVWSTYSEILCSFGGDCTDDPEERLLEGELPPYHFQSLKDNTRNKGKI